MRIALIAPPFIAVPPKKYGGTELFIAELAVGLKEKGIDITLYTNGESTVPVDIRYLFKKEQWPLRTEMETTLRTMTHSSWAVKDAASRQFDLIHVTTAPSLSFSRFVDAPFVYTVHHDFQPELAEYYETFPEVFYVTISDFQRFKLPMSKMRTVHHGIDPSLYELHEEKQQYLTFLGRIAPPKGTHLAIEIAKKSGIPLKIAGEIQPIYQDYWENEVKPHVDGKFIEYVGEVGIEEKNGLLGNSLAMLFPIQWDEPFGLVLIESMACGTPVLAMPGGSVAEIVKEGVSGYVNSSVDELANSAKNLDLNPRAVRQYVEENFSLNRMVNKYIQLYMEIAASDESEEEAERIVA
ncbi:MAG: glycosyl transferase [Candidatus Angelobacter sp. Gp1-AA117]|nr:MAG: glycosyl transferase [Candidatus Angelobacter sp. Gp1-AA117]